jgi:large subunit ribosomal protein L32
MPVPKRKLSKRRRDQRSANKFLKVKIIAACRQCNEPLATHVACKNCGYYKGVKVLTTKDERAEKRGLSMKAKTEAKAKLAAKLGKENESQ